MEQFFLLVLNFFTHTLWQAQSYAWVLPHWKEIVFWWFVGGLGSTVVLYIAFGFAMAAMGARDRGVSQRGVLLLDTVIVIPFFILDIILNMFFYSFLMLDFRPKKWLLRTMTSRFSQYNQDPNERAFRKWAANFFAALLDGKDPKGDHIEGENLKFSWLD